MKNQYVSKKFLLKKKKIIKKIYRKCYRPMISFQNNTKGTLQFLKYQGIQFPPIRELVAELKTYIVITVHKTTFIHTQVKIKSLSLIIDLNQKQ